MDLSDLFSNGKSSGPGPRRVDRRGMAQVHRGPRRAGARARQCSLAAQEEDKLDEVVPEGCSPEHERRRRGGVMEVKNCGGLSSV
jgi:hypothetical protein